MPAHAFEPDIEQVLAEHIGDPSSSLSIGAFGAVAEFFRDRTEATERLSDSIPFGVITPRGAVRIRPRDDILPLAYETPIRRKDAWLHGLALCLVSKDATSSERTVITELGADAGAIRERDRNAILFDLGLGLVNADFCIRTSDPRLLDVLRKAAGSKLLGECPDLMSKLISASPHRVVTSRLGRIEVYQAIDRHRTPSGPHTHVLPKLLRLRRTHDVKVPIPDGYLPCLNIFPGNPAFDPEHDAAAAADTPNRFEELLSRWGNPGYVDQKRRVRAMLESGKDPSEFRLPASRLERSAVRVMLRQLAHDQTLKARVAAWREQFDRGNPAIGMSH